MDSVENRSNLYSLLSSFNSVDNDSIERVLKNDVDESVSDAVKVLNKGFIDKAYGKEGLDRYLRSVLDYWEDYASTTGKSSAGLKKRNLLYNILSSPAKLIAKTYDYILEKTNSHFLSTVSMGLIGGELAEIIAFTGETAYYSSALNLPFMGLFAEEFMANASLFVQIPLLTGLVSALSIAFIVGGTSKVFNHKKLTVQEIENDVKKYAGEFEKTFKKYNKSLFYSKIEPSLGNINAIYMLSSTKAYSKAMNSEEGLGEYEKSMLPYISKVLKKHINPNLILHHSPKGVGGFTLVYNSLLGKLIKNKSYSPVFLNTERFNAVPEYLFALFHELSHGAGATTEQMASYYAEKAMDAVKDDFPLEGYDLFLAVNKLESAVSTLSMKFKSNSEFFDELEKLHLPRFIKESFDYSFNPMFSITFPVSESLYSGVIESKFSSLYASGPYLAKKMVEKGMIRTF